MPLLSKIAMRSRWILWLATCLMSACLLLGFWGASQRHTGRIELTQIGWEPDRFTYSGKLRSDNSIFRGNDLFSVYDTKVLSDQPSPIISAEGIPENTKGGVQIDSKVDLSDLPPPIVEYSLRIRWSKLSHWLALIFTGHLAMAYWQWFNRSTSNSVPDELRLPGNHFKPDNPAASIGLDCSRPIMFTTFLLLALSLLYCLRHILLPIGWMYGDTHFVLSTFVQGKFTAGAIFSDVSRFYPLAFLDLNLLLPFGDSPAAYQIERILMFALHVGLLFHVAAIRCGEWVAALLMLAYLTTAELLRVYCEVIFPETLLTVALVVFVFGYCRAIQKQSIGSGILACFAAVLATYCKEPVFGALTVFALFQILVGYRQLSRTTLTINVFLLVNAVVFLTLYYYLGYGEKNYVDVQSGGASISSVDSVRRFLAIPWVAAMVCLTGYRMYRVVLQTDRRFVFEDGLLLAGTSYVFAFVLLRLTEPYYLVPAGTFWFCALPGYFSIPFVAGSPGAHSNSIDASHSAQIHSAQIHSAQMQSLRWHHFGLLAIMIIGSVSISNTIKGADYARESRQSTAILDRTLHKLSESGFEIYFSFPPDMTERDRFVQKWRKLVVDVFLLNRKQIPIKQIVDQSLTGILNVDEPPSNPLHSKCIIIHDQRYETSWIDQRLESKGKLRRINTLPLLHGAAFYSNPDQIAEIESSRISILKE